jgi:hypothetical protein
MESGMEHQDGQETFAGRLNHLFSVSGTRDGDRGTWRTFSTGEVADLITRSTGTHQVKLSRSYLGMLRSGRYTNPSIAVVLALVHFFSGHLPEDHPEISVDWLASGRSQSTRPQAGEEPLSLHADQQIQHIAMRAGKMTPELRNHLIAILDMMDGKT